MNRVIVPTHTMEHLRPAHASERIEAYRERLADALARGEVDPADIQFRECRGHFTMDALRAFWTGRRK